MRPNESPSVEMLHSVGALMDTSFLRAAVADADGTAHVALTPASFFARALGWTLGMLARAARATR